MQGMPEHTLPLIAVALVAKETNLADRAVVLTALGPLGVVAYPLHAQPAVVMRRPADRPVPRF